MSPAAASARSAHGTCPGLVPSRSAVVMRPLSTMTPAIITAMPGAGRGSPSRIAASTARHRRRAIAAVTTSAMISRTPTVSHANGATAPPGAVRLRRRRRRARGPSEATQDTSVRSLVGTAVQDSVRSRPHPRSRDAESLVRVTRRTSPRIGLNLSGRDIRARLPRSPTLLAEWMMDSCQIHLKTRVRRKPSSTSDARGRSGGTRGA